MFDHLLESSRWDDSSKWSNIEFGQEIDIEDIKIRTLSGALITHTNCYFQMKDNPVESHLQLLIP